MMTWNVEAKISEDEWTREAFIASVESYVSHTPPPKFRLGAVDISWWETTPGVAFIHTEGGTVDDRILARAYAREQLQNVGYRQAQYTVYRNQKVATWDDIMLKAKRIKDSGGVQLLRNGVNTIVGYVQGDHGQYQTEISRDDPNSQTIVHWQCDCPWDQYAWQRTRQWKKYEGRPCAHVMATLWTSQATPLDEEYDPTGQGTLFDPGTAVMPPGSISGTPPVPQPPVPQLSIPGISMPPPAPPGPEILPPPPGKPAPPGVVSIPGGRVPTPADPVQHPGGTFSSWKFADGWDFTQSDDTDGWKFVYDTADGRGIVGGDDTFHWDLEAEIGAGDPHGGTVTSDGLINVYYWPGKNPQVPLGLVLNEDRYPPRLLAWLQGQLPDVNVRYPTDRNEVLEALDHGERIASDFSNSDMVRLEEEEYGVMEGKSEAHGAGQPKLIPKGSIGEVLGEDPTTGWIDVAFAGPQADAGPLEPYHVRAWIEPNKLTPMPNIKKPGPFVRRRN